MSTLSTANIESKAANTPPVIKDLNGTECGTFCRAWINFDGTFGTSPYTLANGGIRSAFNVSSVTENSAGNYTVTMTNALANANFCLVVGGNRYNPGNDNWTIHEDLNHTRTTTTFRLWTNQVASSFDSARICVAVFGD